MQLTISSSDYTFDASNNAITLIDPFDVITTEQIYYIINLSTGVVIYDSERRTHPISMTGAVITHTYDNTGMADADTLQISLDDGTSGASGGVLNNFTATAAPTAADDSDDGYAVGSGWVNVTTDKAYTCVDATAASAVWTETTGAAGAGAVLDTDFNANTVLAADSDDSPAPLTIAVQTLLGRITAGNISALTVDQVHILLNVANGADVTDSTSVAAAGSMMDSDISETEGFVRKTGAGAYEAIKSNLGAAVSPTANEDSGDGYAVGSLWVDTTADKAYVCLDATVASAVWTETTGQGSGISSVVEDTTPQLGGVLDTNAHQVNWSKGSDVASAGALTLGADGNYFDITGTTTITSIVTRGIGTVVGLHFDGILTLTYNAADLVLPSGANITTAAGDEAIFVEYATGDWRCVAYTRADGSAIVGASGEASIWLPVEGAYLPVTNPAALTEVLGATVYGGYSTLDFDDTTQEFAEWRVPFPSYDAGNILVTPKWLCADTSGNVGWIIESVGIAHDENFTQAVVGDAATITAVTAADATTDLNTTTYSTYDPAGVADDDMLKFRIKRNVAVDTMVGDAKLIGVLLTYTKT